MRRGFDDWGFGTAESGPDHILSSASSLAGLICRMAWHWVLLTLRVLTRSPRRVTVRSVLSLPTRPPVRMVDGAYRSVERNPRDSGLVQSVIGGSNTRQRLLGLNGWNLVHKLCMVFSPSTSRADPPPAVMSTGLLEPDPESAERGPSRWRADQPRTLSDPAQHAVLRYVHHGRTTARRPRLAAAGGDGCWRRSSLSALLSAAGDWRTAPEEPGGDGPRGSQSEQG